MQTSTTTIILIQARKISIDSGLIYLLHSFGVFRLSNGCFSDKFHLLDRLIIIGNH